MAPTKRNLSKETRAALSAAGKRGVKAREKLRRLKKKVAKSYAAATDSVQSTSTSARGSGHESTQPVKKKRQRIPTGRPSARPKNRFKQLSNVPSNFVTRAKQYAQAAVADTKGESFNIWIRLAAARFVKDLERAKSNPAPFTFDAARAEHVCKWVECLPHVEGKWDTPTIVLADAQVFFLVNLFGFRYSRDVRRFSVALFAVARKNAKSTLAAAIMLYILCEEPEPGGQLYAAATTGDQARVVWRIAKAMADRCYDLREEYGIDTYSLDIRRVGTSSFFKPINAKASTQDGLNPQAFVLDELHAHKTHDLMNVLRDAAGARTNPLFLYTTTEGFETPGPWPEVRLFAQQVLQGSVEADHFLAIIYSLDEENDRLGTKLDDDFDSTKWRKANPLWDTNPILRRTVEALAAEAKAMPGKLGEFRIKRLNRQSSAAHASIDIVKWKACAGPGRLQLEDLVGMQCWGALDLSSVSDMTSWCQLFYDGAKWYAFMRYFVPRAATQFRTERRSVPYQAWIDAGWVTQTEGDRVDYAVIRETILADVQVSNPVKIAYDPWNAQQLVTELTQQGLELEVFIQGPRSYHPAIQALDIAYASQQLVHGGNPVLQWNAANLVPRYDVNLNSAPDKKRSADKIDGICALLMAFGLAIVDTDDGSSGFFEAPIA